MQAANPKVLIDVASTNKYRASILVLDGRTVHNVYSMEVWYDATNKDWHVEANVLGEKIIRRFLTADAEEDSNGTRITFDDRNYIYLDKV